jgi:hypothetical protein
MIYTVGSAAERLRPVLSEQHTEMALLACTTELKHAGNHDSARHPNIKAVPSIFSQFVCACVIPVHTYATLLSQISI